MVLDNGRIEDTFARLSLIHPVSLTCNDIVFGRSVRVSNQMKCRSTTNMKLSNNSIGGRPRLQSL